MTKEEDLAWAAGFFDGEGCTSFNKRVGKTGKLGRIVIQVSISQNDPEVLYRFQKIFDGRGKIYFLKKCGNKKNDSYRWNASSHKNVLFVLEHMWPYLGTLKRKQAEKALEAYKEDRKYLFSRDGQPRKRMAELVEVDGEPVLLVKDEFSWYGGKVNESVVREIVRLKREQKL